MNVIDLDANATTAVLPEAWEAMRSADAYGNPSSAHALGRAARRLLEDARDRVAELLGATADEVIFTSGATEANNLALFGLPPPSPGRERGPGGEVLPTRVLAAPLEHPCVIGPLKELEKRGVGVEWLPVTDAGVVEQKAVLDRVTADTTLVTLMMVNHETGAIQPVRHVAKTLPKRVLLHTDAAQAVGKLPVNFRDLGVTALTASGHKFRGPKGVGLLLLKKGTKLIPQMHGGHQQRGNRPGTEPVQLAVGLAAALDFAVKNLAENVARVTAARDAFLRAIRASRVFFVVNTPEDAVPHVVNLSFPGCRSELLLMALDLAGVACSTGSACSSGSLLPSPVLQAMGVPAGVLESAMRFSFGTTLTPADATDAARRVVECVRRMQVDAKP